ncbi:MAG: hypothetical protein AAFO07_19135 [Bacteroidota bacterium]
MNKSTLLFALFLLLSAFTLSAQNTDVIDDTLEKYIKATNEKDWNAALDLVYEKLFTLAPKEQMLAMFQQMDAMGMSIKMTDYSITNKSEPIEADSSQFVIVNYDSREKLTLNNEAFSGDEMINMMKQQFVMTYGEDGVSWDKESKTFDLKGKKTMLAISKDGENWKFIEYKNTDPNQKMIFSQIIPAEVIEALN